MRTTTETRIRKDDANYRAGSSEMQANDSYEVEFRTWLIGRLRTLGSYDYITAMTEGAEIVTCSPLTTKRYLSKLTSPAGPLMEGKDKLGHRILLLKPHLEKRTQGNGHGEGGSA